MGTRVLEARTGRRRRRTRRSREGEGEVEVEEEAEMKLEMEVGLKWDKEWRSVRESIDSAKITHFFIFKWFDLVLQMAEKESFE